MALLRYESSKETAMNMGKFQKLRVPITGRNRVCIQASKGGINTQDVNYLIARHSLDTQYDTNSIGQTSNGDQLQGTRQKNLPPLRTMITEMPQINFRTSYSICFRNCLFTPILDFLLFLM